MTKISVIRPINVNGEWFRSGEHEISDDVAQMESARGNVVIISVDGIDQNGSGCCRDHA